MRVYHLTLSHCVVRSEKSQNFDIDIGIKWCMDLCRFTSHLHMGIFCLFIPYLQCHKKWQIPLSFAFEFADIKSLSIGIGVSITCSFLACFPIWNYLLSLSPHPLPPCPLMLGYFLPMMRWVNYLGGRICCVACTMFANIFSLGFCGVFPLPHLFTLCHMSVVNPLASSVVLSYSAFFLPFAILLQHRLFDGS